MLEMIALIHDSYMDGSIFRNYHETCIKMEFEVRKVSYRFSCRVSASCGLTDYKGLYEYKEQGMRDYRRCSINTIQDLIIQSKREKHA